MVEGCRKAIKYAMLMANLLILIGGIVVFSIGVWTLADKAFMESLLGSNLYVSSAAILIATGVIVIIIAFLGCMGAFKEIKCMLLTFFIILFMIFITMLVGGILGYVFRNEVDEHMHSEMLKTVKQYMNDTPVTEAWDAVQEKFECCGMIPGEDTSHQPYKIWMDMNHNFKMTGPQVPSSCCKSKALLSQCQRNPSEETTWMKGCYEELKEFVKRHAIIVGGIGIGISCVLILGMVFSCALFLLIGS
ncbi:CD151 antigen-like [Limulus polyphemus]|uniref:Tetraspanin n=1 Tax=Limulus polyphemus TaxID=6850 RepID=A0ABM1B763_LIMPO|nr:CD151 antigen-like [Limulus polyphemus]XP_022243472.1 CD151 antigen-like [Limulus polyphemus]